MGLNFESVDRIRRFKEWNPNFDSGHEDLIPLLSDFEIKRHEPFQPDKIVTNVGRWKECNVPIVRQTDIQRWRHLQFAGVIVVTVAFEVEGITSYELKE